MKKGMKPDWTKVEEEVSREYPLEKYRAFRQQILDHEMAVAYLKTPEGKEAMGAEKAESAIKESESMIRRLKAQCNHIRNYFA